MDEQRRPLLEDAQDGIAAEAVARAEEGLPPPKRNTLHVSPAEVFQTWKGQAKMAWPLVLQLVSLYALSVVSLSFVGHLGTKELAAAALGTSFINMVGRMVLLGLNGALDTMASQAYGSGDLAALPLLYFRAVAFLWLHAVPLTLLLLAAPYVLTWQKDADMELVNLAFTYLLYLIPNLWLEALARPLNSVLVAQRITQPQTLVALLMVPLHIGNNYLLIHVAQLGYLGAALATCATSLTSFLLTLLVLRAAGLLSRVIAPIDSLAAIFQGWPTYARLAYPACFMRVAESLGFSLVTLTSGLLPNPAAAVSAASIAFNVYGILYMPFAATSMSTAAFVGNALGSGDAHAARVTSVSSILLAPLLWLFVGGILVEPHTQRALALLFTDGSDPVLMHHLTQLLYIVAALELFDGTQTIMSGIITGSGRQKYGAVINLLSFYILAIPAALVMGFWAERGVEGMYMGMALGPLMQMVCYGTVVARMDWRKEAAKANDRLASTR